MSNAPTILTKYAPYGSAFSPFISRDLGRNLLGSVPILGIYFGYKRICAVSKYIGTLGEHTKIAKVVVKEMGSEIYQLELANTYKLKHYLRGVAEIVGLGIVVTILELVSTILCLLVLAFGYLLGCCLMAIYYPLDFLHNHLIRFIVDRLGGEKVVEPKLIEEDNLQDEDISSTKKTGE